MKKQSYLFLVLFFGVTLFCYAQNKQQKIDSLTVLLETTSSDSLRVSRTIDLGVLIDTSDPIKASEYFKNALTILEGNYPFSDRATQQALAYDCLGIIERRRNNYGKALQHYLTSLKIKEKARDSSKIGRSYHNIAMLFRSQGKYDKAISYMKKALVMRRSDSLDYGVSLNNYGHFLYLKKELDSSLIVLDSAKNYFTEPLYLSDVNRYKAKVYRAKKMYQKAFELHKQNLVIYKKEEKIERLASTMKDLAFNARKMNLFSEASKYLDSSEVLAAQYGNKILLGRLYLERYKIERDQKKYKKALSFYRTYKKYRDSSRTIEQSERFEKLALEFKFKQEAYRDSLQASTEKIELQRVAKSQRSQKRLFAVLFFLALLALISLFLLYRYKRKINLRNRQKQELETELLNEKVNFLRYKTERLLMDNKMRIDFKKELLDTIKELQTKESSTGIVDTYQSILIQLKNQINTEKRLDSVSEVNNMSEANFEMQLAERFPDLTKAEREICHLIYLNLSLKEIMNVRSATLSSIKSARYRIRKKLQIEKGVELELFIKQLF
ncbi:tetratricopeptide repeat protein [uncultured Kordia sp.]|uniref:tetratricopeptide repeat protein n=1 Tax=uncultured Kordia sp. TaxID=507699 RepID=UPI002612C648|nr:tetratricopeptide repeat protein [uncultured Kordia sp.]